LTQEHVSRALLAARSEAASHGWAVTIAIVDDGGHLLALERMDNCAAASAYIAPEKARSSALGKRKSRDYEDMINGGRNAFLSVPMIKGLLTGGVPVILDGHLVGAVGVSGVKPDEDEKVANAGALALVRPEEHSA
jgi:glc operon protein GlcG